MAVVGIRKGRGGVRRSGNRAEEALWQERYLGGAGWARPSECCWPSWILKERREGWTSVWMGQRAGAAEGLEWETEGPRDGLDQAALVLTPFMVYKEI